MSRAAIVDIDGTLVDTNYHHAIAWFRAFSAFDVTLPLWRIHRHMGMGGDQLVGSLTGEGFEEERGEEVRAAEKSLYMELIDEVRPMDGARELLEHLKEMDVGVVLASSAKAEEVDHYLDLLDARAIVKGWTTSADVDNTKPEPDLVKAALEKADADESLMIGDSTFDCEAAKRAGIATVAVLTGGFSQQELEEAGAARVYESVRALHEKLEDVPFRVS